MATEIIATMQGTGEQRIHFIDFTNDLPTGVTISTGTATHTPPSGASVTPTVGVPVGAIVPVTVPALTVTGRHIVTLNATLSDAEVITARLIIPVQWDTCRVGMADIIADLRGMTDAGSNDYAIGGIPYWTDKHLQDRLDRFATVFDYEPMTVFAQRAGTVYTYKKYVSNIQNWEGTPSILDSNGGTISGTSYSFDNRTGEANFTATQAGSARLISGTIYNLNAAASDVWLTKAAHFASKYDISAGGNSLKRSQLIQQARQMADYYASMSLPGGAIYVERSDF
jgi:hypothetical protein